MSIVNRRALAICAAIGFAIFLMCFHVEVLNPGNVHWLLQFDWGASFVGWEAYRHDAWRLPLGAEQLLDWPAGDNIVFTDSFPALAFLFKILSPVLPDPFQYIGLWFLTSLILQVVFGYRLSRRAGLDELSALIGAFLIGLTPFYLARLYHNTLFSHWMILWALELYGFERDEKTRNVGFGVLLVLTALTNFYLTFMAAGIYAADILRTRLRRRKAGPDAPPSDGTEAKTVAPLIIAMGLVGYFGVRQSAAGGFGVYAAELFAWLNPQTPLTSRVLPAWPVSVGAYEGFQYLGLGVIGLVVLGLGLQLWGMQRKRSLGEASPQTTDETRFDGAAYLAPVMVGFFLFSLSDKIRVGEHLLVDLHYGPLLGPITAMLRSSGRFMWPVSYALILSALLAVARLPRPRVLLVLLVALTVQIADLSAFLQQQRKFTEVAAEPGRFHRVKSAQWDRLIARARAVDFQPADPQPRLDLFWELAYRAVKLGVPMTDMYSARVAPAQYAFQKADEAAVREGRIASDRLYVLADDCAPFTTDAVYRLDGVMIIPPVGADLSGLTREPTRPPPGRPGAPIAFSSPEARCLLGSGWRTPEGSGVMSDGAEADLHLPLPLPLPGGEAGPLVLSLQVRGLSAGRFGLKVLSGDTALVPQGAAANDTAVFVVPEKALAGRRVLSLTLRATTGSGASGPDFQLIGAQLRRGSTPG